METREAELHHQVSPKCTDPVPLTIVNTGFSLICLIQLFTESVPRTIQSSSSDVHLDDCLYDLKVVIVDSQTVRVLVFLLIYK